MPSTTNKGLEVQVTGTNSDTWGDLLNSDVISFLDLMIGGTLTKTLASSTPVDLTAAESRNLIVRLIGTISANIAITTLCKGMTIVENATSGAFTVTFAFNGAGSAITIPSGTRALIATDGTNGARQVASSQTEFASGTVMLFYQAAAPTGWTKSTANNDKALRVVSGAGGVSGGTVAFATAFASQAVGGTVGGTALSVDQLPSHGHPTMMCSRQTSNAGQDAVGGIMMRDAATQVSAAAYNGTVDSTVVGHQVGGTGNNQTHNHSFAGNAINLAVQYIDVIVAAKD